MFVDVLLHRKISKGSYPRVHLKVVDWSKLTKKSAFRKCWKWVPIHTNFRVPKVLLAFTRKGAILPHFFSPTYLNEYSCKETLNAFFSKL